MEEPQSSIVLPICPDCDNDGRNGTIQFVGSVGPHPERLSVVIVINILECGSCGYKPLVTPWGLIKDCPHCGIGSGPEEWVDGACPECGKKTKP